MVFLAPPNPGSTDESQLRIYLQTTLEHCRAGTLALVDNISQTVLQQQAHPDFSPVGWHLGHIALTESLWILEHLAQQPCPFPEYRTLFAADGLPKVQRQHLPNLDDLLRLLADVRQRVMAYLATAPLTDQLRLWHWLVQHECQHSETMTLVMALHQRQGEATPLQAPIPGKGGSELSTEMDMVSVPGGDVCLGLEGGIHDPVAIDNEQPAHWVEVAPYQIDSTPVTCGQYQHFLVSGGYQERRWWCDAGWRWLQSTRSKSAQSPSVQSTVSQPTVSQPLYWPGANLVAFCHHPVCGVNWYEASAYARFVDKRLPTEAEWALATQGLTAKLPRLLQADRINCDHRVGYTSPVGMADPSVQQAVAQQAAAQQVAQTSASDYGCYDLLGNVWEWTDSWFRPYPGFEAYPYRGYSAAYFDDRHRVLRGGSWATRPWALRPSFRNWYEPHVRELFMGFRCAR